MKHAFYRPVEGWAGDFIPFYWNGEYNLFYLRDIRSPRGHFDGVPWYRVTTKDFVDFTDHGVVLEPGGYDDQDLCVYTGCALWGEGKFHIFYVGMNPRMRAHGRPEQGFMHAISDDLQHWTKLPGTNFSPDGYEDHDWRDPFVFFEEADELYHMLLAARKSVGPRVRRGVTAHLTSKDLNNWEVKEPLWAPESYYTHECPDLFKIGEWYYLLMSEFTDSFRTRYVMSKSLYGPWISPRDDVFDTRAYYAAKSASDGNKRYLFGWNPTRVDGDDMKDFHWGGNLVVHELYALENGELAVREPESIAKAWGEGASLPLGGGVGEADLYRVDGMVTAYTEGAMPRSFRLEADVTFSEGTREFGFMLRADEDADSSYGLIFEPAAGKVSFDQLPEPTWNYMRTRGLDRLLPMQPGRKMHLTLIVDDTIALLYAGDKIALSTRMYNLRGDKLALFVRHGRAHFENVRVSLNKPR